MMSLDRGWWSFLGYDDQRGRPTVNRAVLRRVVAYARPYFWRIAMMLATIVAITFLGLVPPLLIRQLIDHALPERDFGQLHQLALGMVAVPVIPPAEGVSESSFSAMFPVMVQLRKLPPPTPTPPPVRPAVLLAIVELTTMPALAIPPPERSARLL